MSKRLQVLILLACSLASCALGQSQPSAPPVFVLHDLGRATLPLDGEWQFHEGDDLGWASPSYDDSAWQPIRTGPSCTLPQWRRDHDRKWFTAGPDVTRRVHRDKAALAPQDSLTFLSDGVVEARNAAGELFGFARTTPIASQTAEQIARAAQHFGQDDDITVLRLRFDASGDKERGEKGTAYALQ